jgi:fatty-acyl-CoA synthase
MGAVTDLGVGSWPWRRARMDPAAIAFRQGDRAVSYRTLADRVEALARGLRRLGVQRGDRVAYLGQSDIRTFEAFFACGRLGAVFAPLNYRLAPPEIAFLLADSGAAVFLYAPEYAGTVAAAGVEIRHAVEVGPAYEALLVDGEPLESTVDLADDALILYTSGTTGRPKGAVLTHGSLTFNTVNQLVHLDVLNRETVVCTAPLYHVTGLGQVSLPTLLKGGTVVVAPRFDPPELLRTIAAHRVVAFSCVPTMLQLLCDCPEWTDADLSCLRYVVYGGSPIDPRVARAWRERGVDVLQGYGMTEAAPGVLMQLPGRDEPLSAGVPHFFTEVALLAPDGTRRPGPGAGELAARGPNLFRGYWQRPEDTAAVLGEDGWFRSGDVVRLDPDGRGHVIDRVQDVIISGGENIYPAELEAVLRQAPGVGECAVVGVPDERWGEVGVAFLVPAQGARLDDEDVRVYLEERLARFKVPKYLRVVAELPRTSTGKIQRGQLRRIAAG